MSRARRLRTPDADRPTWRAISRRVEAGHEPECQEPSVVRAQSCQRALEIDKADDVGWVAAGVHVKHVGDVDDRATSLPAHRLASFVGSDGDEPGPHLIRVTQCRQSTPRDRPGCLDGVARRLGIAADDERDSRHGLAVL